MFIHFINSTDTEPNVCPAVGSINSLYSSVNVMSSEWFCPGTHVAQLETNCSKGDKVGSAEIVVDMFGALTTATQWRSIQNEKIAATRLVSAI
jgi:hypothetical protein